MAIGFEEVKIGTSKEMPAKVILYGVPKIGKSRFAADFPDAFFINIEDGLSYLGKEVRSTPKLESYDDVMAWLVHIHSTDSFTAGRIVVDSLDWFEALARKSVEDAHGGKSISDQAYKPFSYGAGMALVADKTNRIFTALDAIYKTRGIPSLLIAHSQIRTIDLPNKDPYSKYELKLGKAVAAKAAEWADLILFADYSFVVTSDGKTSEPKPVLLAGGSASFTGGGRMRLSKEIPLSYEALKGEITK